MTTLSASERSAKVDLALSKIGTSNGTACPTPASNVDAVLHEYWIARKGKSYFESREKKAKTALEDAVLDASKIEEKRQRQLRGFRCDGEELYRSDNYAVEVSTKAPATRLDDGELRKQMLREGLSDEVIERIMKAGTLQNAVPITITVKPINGK